MTYLQVHVPEIPDPGGVVECTWATGVEVVRAAFDGRTDQPPPTGAEREALRVAGGGSDTGGANYEQLMAGCQNRYGWAPRLGNALPATEIPEGTFLGVQGLYAALPTHYQRWDPNFAAQGAKSAHSLVVYKVAGVLTICDPLAPAQVQDPKLGLIDWTGESVTWAIVQAFWSALSGAQVISTTVGAATAMDVSTLKAAAYCNVRPGGSLYADLASATVLVPSWAGGSNIGTIGTAKRPDGALMRALIVDDPRTSGTNLIVGWTGDDHCALVAGPSTPVAVTITGVTLSSVTANGKTVAF